MLLGAYRINNSWYTEMTHCRICEAPVTVAFKAIALRKYPFEAVSCCVCGFLQIADPHWLEEAYGHAIAPADTGLVLRNIDLAAQLRPLLYFLFQTDGRYVDYAGGTGLFVRLMRDAGLNFHWHDPYCSNTHARGFEFVPDGEIVNAITAFEVLEHVSDPISFIKEAMNTARAEMFICTTQLFGGAPPDPDKWWYYAFNAGQHISFYQHKTLVKISEGLGLRLYSNGSTHIFYRGAYRRRLIGYFRFGLVRQIANYRAKRHLKSKTMEDHLKIIGKTAEVPNSGLTARVDARSSGQINRG